MDQKIQQFYLILDIYLTMILLKIYYKYLKTALDEG
ncbi:Uncharacterised protein [uncultured Clostridium sp.]|nr:Uncharacterised protein [uncultured Clostridium sp.]